VTKTNILQETVNMLSLEIYLSLHCVVAFKHTDRWRLYNIIRQAIPSINDPAAKKVERGSTTAFRNSFSLVDLSSECDSWVWIYQCFS